MNDKKIGNKHKYKLDDPHRKVITLPGNAITAGPLRDNITLTSHCTVHYSTPTLREPTVLVNCN